MSDLARLQCVVNNDKTNQKEENINMADYLKLATGGSDVPPDGNWLSLLAENTVFLVRDKKSPNFALGHFKILDKTEKTVFLGTSSPSMPPMIPVEPIRFCQMYALHEVLCITDLELEKDTAPTLELTPGVTPDGSNPV